MLRADLQVSNLRLHLRRRAETSFGIAHQEPNCSRGFVVAPAPSRQGHRATFPQHARIQCLSGSSHFTISLQNKRRRYINCRSLGGSHKCFLDSLKSKATPDLRFKSDSTRSPPIWILIRLQNGQMSVLGLWNQNVSTCARVHMTTRGEAR